MESLKGWIKSPALAVKVRDHPELWEAAAADAKNFFRFCCTKAGIRQFTVAGTIINTMDEWEQLAEFWTWYALQRYNESLGFSPTTFLVTSVVGYLRRELYKVRRPVKISEDITMVPQTVPWDDYIAAGSQTSPITYADIVPDDKTENEFYDIDFDADTLLHEFSPKARQVIELRANGYRQREIAKLLGISQPNVSRYLLRAKRVYESWAAH